MRQLSGVRRDPDQDVEAPQGAFRPIWERLSQIEVDSGLTATAQQVAAGANTPASTSMSTTSDLWSIYIHTGGFLRDHVGGLYVRVIAEELEKDGIDGWLDRLPTAGTIWDAFVTSTVRFDHQVN